MRHQKTGKILGRKKAPRKALLRSLATSFFVYEKIRTTEAKAKVLRPIVEKMISLAKKDTLAHRRQALSYLYLAPVVKKLFELIGPRFQNRPGGYTRLVKLLPRKTDGAKMAILALVESKAEEKAEKKEK